ncbi:MAG: hypothetical protein GY880_32655 [Planctomycetaceae bacterium]|nr:hypothetical protein [Planctomycetaceae bacterium]
METIAALLSGAAIASLTFLFKKLSAEVFFSKYGKTIEVVFQVLDPLAGDLINGYNESDVQKAIELVVTRVSDSDLSNEDALAITQFVIEKFNPMIASSKALDPGTPEGKATIELSGSLKSLADGVTFEELSEVAQKASALV